jgi:hypothetical protein
MPDLENRMPGILHDLARDARPDPELERRVLRRSRRRRIANVTLAGATAVAVVVGGVLIAGAIGTGGRTTPIDDTTPPAEVAPTPLPAIWPETDARSLAIAQAMADGGVLGWRLDPTATAEMYAAQELGWKPADVVVTGSSSDPESGATAVTIIRSDDAGGPSTAPETELSLRQLGDTGAPGVWSVVGADTAVILPGEDQDGRWPTTALAGSQLELVGTRVGEGGEWTLVVSTTMLTPVDETGIGSSAEGSGMSSLGAQSGPFTESVFIPASSTGIVVVSLAIADEQGNTVALDSFPVAVETPGGAAGEDLVAAVWPETTVEGLQAAQDRADRGVDSWRTDPVETAIGFATAILGWDADDVVAEETDRPRIGTSFVTVSNLGLGPGQVAAGPAAPSTVLTVEQLGREGELGIWSVTAAESDRILIDSLLPNDPGVHVEGRLVEAIPEWSLSAWPIVDARRVEPATPVTVDASGAFAVQVTAAGYPEGSPVGLLVALWDPEGTLVTADATSYVVPGDSATTTAATGPGGPAGATSPPGPMAPISTAMVIATAAQARDFQVLQTLIDPDRFSYNFSDGHNPVPEWRDNPAVLDTLATILQMPSTTTGGTPDVGTITIWPALVDADLTDLTPEERAMLDELGFTDADVQDMLDAFGGYVGPRTGIAEDGTWLYYTTGGD